MKKGDKAGDLALFFLPEKRGEQKELKQGQGKVQFPAAQQQ